MGQEDERQRIECSDCVADIPNDGNCWYCENEPRQEGIKTKFLVQGDSSVAMLPQNDKM